MTTSGLQNVIIVGAGLSGIAMAIQLQRKLKFTDFEIYEKYNRVGGTWAKAVQPNAGCDIASHVRLPIPPIL
jgi:cation diffusion facilitator CzcD-associated flavoprotein CzcO